MMMIMVGLILNFTFLPKFNNQITGMKDMYSLSESEVNSFFDDDGGGMDVTLSGIHGKFYFCGDYNYNYFHYLLY